MRLELIFERQSCLSGIDGLKITKTQKIDGLSACQWAHGVITPHLQSIKKRDLIGLATRKEMLDGFEEQRFTKAMRSRDDSHSIF